MPGKPSGSYEFIDENVTKICVLRFIVYATETVVEKSDSTRYRHRTEQQSALHSRIVEIKCRYSSDRGSWALLALATIYTNGVA